MSREFAKLTVTPKAERAARAGHPWVYGEEVTAVSGAYRNGDIVDVYTQKDRWLGAGFVNDHSKIRVRLLSRNTNDRFDEAFFRRRVPERTAAGHGAGAAVPDRSPGGGPAKRESPANHRDEHLRQLVRRHRLF